MSFTENIYNLHADGPYLDLASQKMMAHKFKKEYH